MKILFYFISILTISNYFFSFIQFNNIKNNYNTFKIMKKENKIQLKKLKNMYHNIFIQNNYIKNKTKSLLKKFEKLKSEKIDYDKNIDKILNQKFKSTKLFLKKNTFSHKELSRVILKRIENVQFRTKCDQNTKYLICNIKKCNFGCQINKLVSCLYTSFTTNRVLIINSKNLNIEKCEGNNNFNFRIDKEWACYFRAPICYPEIELSKNNIKKFSLKTQFEKEKVLDFNIDCKKYDDIFFNSKFTNYLHSNFIPALFHEKILKFNPNPSIWVFGHFLRSLLNPNKYLSSYIVQSKRRLNLKKKYISYIIILIFYKITFKLGI
jgi:hypothetical protein